MKGFLSVIVNQSPTRGVRRVRSRYRHLCLHDMFACVLVCLQYGGPISRVCTHVQGSHFTVQDAVKVNPLVRSSLIDLAGAAEGLRSSGTSYDATCTAMHR